jgi:acetyltransferase-like isoleucine patch superfamily enzyme
MNMRVRDVAAVATWTVGEWSVAQAPGGIGRRLRKAYWRQRLGRMGKNCVIDVGVRILNPSFVFLGDNVWLDAYVQILAGPVGLLDRTTFTRNQAYLGEIGEVHIGSNTHVAPFCVLQGHAGISVGRDCGIAAHSLLYSLSHHHRVGKSVQSPQTPYEEIMKFTPLAPPEQQSLIGAPVVMGDASAVGLQSILLPGSTVGRYSWVGVHSVVKDAIPDGVIASGNPAQVVKDRFADR